MNVGMKRKFIVIGLTDSRDQYFSPEIIDVISSSNVFSGGKRHKEIVEPFLPQNAQWIDITVPLKTVYERYESHSEIVVFASGDPLFYGFGGTLKREFPNAEIKVYPTSSSLQLLANRMVMPYQDMKNVSLTGRPWHEFDAALIRGYELIGVLTDRKCTPVSIAKRMCEYGFDEYEMTVGECLGNETKERIRTFRVETVRMMNDDCFEFPNCLILRCVAKRKRKLGIPESEFELLNGREKMITKSTIRLAAISALELDDAEVMWDIGFCTGSVSIEAKQMYPELKIVAFEQRSECRDIIQKNMIRFGTPGINVRIGDFLQENLEGIPAPDAVFIGGHGGKLVDMIGKIMPLMPEGGRIVLNAVSPGSIMLFEEAAALYGLKIIARQRVVIDEHNPILIISALKIG